MKKTTYISPEIESLQLDVLQLLSGSPVDEGANDKNDDDYITDPGDLGAKGKSYWESDYE